MNRMAFACLLAIWMVPFVALADVVVTSSGGIATPGLPGFKTVVFTATSTVPGEFIHVVDFIGDPDNNDPGTARGFFGAMYQVPILGNATVFDTHFAPSIIDPPFPELFSLDSHFLIRVFGNSGIDVVVPVGYAKESATSLRAIYAGNSALGQSIDIAKLVIPDAATGIIQYRGSFAIARGGTLVDTPDVVGFISTVPEPTAALLAGIAVLAITGTIRRNRQSS